MASNSAEKFKFALLDAWFELARRDDDITSNEIYNSTSLQSDVVSSVTQLLTYVLDAATNDCVTEYEKKKKSEAIVAEVTAALRQYHRERDDNLRALGGRATYALGYKPLSTFDR